MGARPHYSLPPSGSLDVVTKFILSSHNNLFSWYLLSSNLYSRSRLFAFLFIRYLLLSLAFVKRKFRSSTVLLHSIRKQFLTEWETFSPTHHHRLFAPIYSHQNSSYRNWALSSFKRCFTAAKPSNNSKEMSCPNHFWEYVDNTLWSILLSLWN
jgi:hypothetical protein